VFPVCQSQIKRNWKTTKKKRKEKKNLSTNGVWTKKTGPSPPQPCSSISNHTKKKKKNHKSDVGVSFSLFCCFAFFFLVCVLPGKKKKKQAKKKKALKPQLRKTLLPPSRLFPFCFLVIVIAFLKIKILKQEYESKKRHTHQWPTVHLEKAPSQTPSTSSSPKTHH